MYRSYRRRLKIKGVGPRVKIRVIVRVSMNGNVASILDRRQFVKSFLAPVSVGKQVGV